MFAQDFGASSYDIDWDLQASEWDWRGLNDLSSDAGLEDFWKKFEELPDLGDDFESLLDVNSDLGDLSKNVLLNNHDCMWAGTCGNQHHKAETKPPPPPPPVRPVQVQSATVSNGVIIERSVPAPRKRLVRTPDHRPPRPDTPPSLSESEDEDDSKAPADTVAPASGPPLSQAPVPIRHTIETSAFDHNYDKTVRSEDYGLQTPSDSEEDQNQSSGSEEEEEEEEEEECEEEEEEDDEEEEIDVVSLSRVPPVRIEYNKLHLSYNHMTPTRDSLPTNPSREIKKQLQKKVASAITNNSLLSAKRAVSRRLKQTKRTKRKRTSSDEEGEDEMDAQVHILQQKSSFHHPQQQNRRKSSSSGRTPKKCRFSDSEPDSEKRSLHNNMERMRRIDLRNALEDLKSLLPSLATAQRAPKVTILKDATSYLHELRQKDRTLSSHVTKLRAHQEELRSTLSRLRKTLASIRARS